MRPSRWARSLRRRASGSFEHPPDRRRVDGAGADAVDADVLAGVVDGEAAGEVDHGRLAGAVDDARRVAAQSRDRRRRHDRAAAAGGEDRHGVLRAEEHRAHVDGHHEVPVLLGQADGGAGADRAGVVEQRVEPTERVDGERRPSARRRRRRRRWPGRARRCRPRPSIERDGLVDLGTTDVGGDDQRTLGGEAQRAGPADARSSPGDDGDLPCEQHPRIVARHGPTSRVRRTRPATGVAVRAGGSRGCCRRTG